MYKVENLFLQVFLDNEYYYLKFLKIKDTSFNKRQEEGMCLIAEQISSRGYFSRTY